VVTVQHIETFLLYWSKHGSRSYTLEFLAEPEDSAKGVEVLLAELNKTPLRFEHFIRRMIIVKAVGELGDASARPAQEELIHTDTQEFDAWGAGSVFLLRNMHKTLLRTCHLPLMNDVVVQNCPAS
jgi:hypothetical protein